MFEINNLKFKDILDIEHLVIDRDVTCICGISGSGKTTLLRMLNRLQSPDEGVIMWNHQDIKTMNPTQLRRNVVMLSQTPVLYHGTIEDNLQIGLQFSKQPKANKTTLQQYLDLVSLQKELHESVQTLSGGEKQRLCLARIMLMQADVYLLDEPSSALDKETEQVVIEKMVEFVKANQKMLILITHSSEIIKQYPGSIMEIQQGRCGGYRNE